MELRIAKVNIMSEASKWTHTHVNGQWNKHATAFHDAKAAAPEGIRLQRKVRACQLPFWDCRRHYITVRAVLLAYDGLVHTSCTASAIDQSNCVVLACEHSQLCQEQLPNK